MLKLISLIISFSLVLGTITPSYAQAVDAVKRQKTAVQFSNFDFNTFNPANNSFNPTPNPENPDLEKALNNQISSQTAAPGSVEERLNNYCNILPTCNPQENEESLFTLIVTEAEFVQMMRDIAKSMNTKLDPKFDLSKVYKMYKQDHTAKFNAMFADFQKIYRTLPKDHKGVSQLVSEVMPAALMLTTPANTQQRDIANNIYKTYFSYLNVVYPNVKSLKKAAEASEKAAKADKAEKYDLGSVLLGAITGYSLVAKSKNSKELVELVSKTAVTPLAAQTVHTFVAAMKSAGDYDTIENFLRAASVMEVKQSDRGNVMEAFSAFGAMFSPTTYIKEGSKGLNTLYAGGNISKYGFYQNPDGTLGNAWEDIPGILVSGNDAKGRAVVSKIFYNGLTITNSTSLEPKAHWNHGVLIPFIVGAIGTRQVEKRPLEGLNAFKKYYGSNLNLLGAVELNLLGYKMYDLDDATYARVRGILTQPYRLAIEDALPIAAASQLNFNVFSTNGRSPSGYNQSIYNPQNKTGLILNEKPAVRAANVKLYGQVIAFSSVLDAAIGLYFMGQLWKGVTSMVQWSSSYVKVISAVRQGATPLGKMTWIQATKKVVTRKPILKELARLEKAQVRAQRNPTAVNRAKLDVQAARVEARIGQVAFEDASVAAQKSGITLESITAKINKKQPLTNAEAKVWNNLQRYTRGEKALHSAKLDLKEAKEASRGLDYFETIQQAREANAAADVARMHRAHSADLAKGGFVGRRASAVADNGPKWHDFFSKSRLGKFVNKQATTLTLSLMLTTMSPNVSNSATAVSSLSRSVKPVLELVDPRLMRGLSQGETALFNSSTWKLVNLKTPRVASPQAVQTQTVFTLNRGVLPAPKVPVAAWQRVAVKPLFMNGEFNSATFVSAVKTMLRAGSGTLSATGLGDITARINDARIANHAADVLQQIVDATNRDFDAGLMQSEKEFRRMLDANIKKVISEDKKLSTIENLDAFFINQLNNQPFAELRENRYRVGTINPASSAWYNRAGVAIKKLLSPKKFENPSGNDLQKVESLIKDLSSYIIEDLAQEAAIILERIKSLSKSNAKKIEGLSKKDGKPLTYLKVWTEYSDLITAFLQGKRLSYDGKDISTKSPLIIDTGIEGYPHLYTDIMFKGSYETKDGPVSTRDRTFAISDKKGIFEGIKQGEKLVADSYGNLYKLTAKGKKKYFHDKSLSVVRLPELENMPVVVINDDVNRYFALKNIFAIMGFSSIGRFLKDAVAKDFSSVLGNAAETIATTAVTSIYLCNLAALPMGSLIKKFGTRDMLRVSQGLIALGLVAPSLFGMSGLSEFAPTWTRLVVLVASLLSVGIGAAGIQQIGNPTAKDILKGQDASFATSAGQLFKSLGSMFAYLSFYVALDVLGLGWTFMYLIMLLPTISAFRYALKADLPYTPGETTLKDYFGMKLNTINEKLGLKVDTKYQTSAQIAAERAAQQLQNVEKTPWYNGPLMTFLKDKTVWPLFTALAFFCGSEMVVSVATKQMITELLGLGKDGDGLAILITGAATMGPIIAGRWLSTYIMQNFKDVKSYNEKMMVLSSAMALAGTTILKLLGPDGGALSIPAILLANLGFANLFSLAFNIMKNHDEKVYQNKFKTQTGTLSTLALSACWILPSLVSILVPGGSEVVFSKLAYPMALILAGMALNYKYFMVNPFDWKKTKQDTSSAATETKNEAENNDSSDMGKPTPQES